MSNEKDTRWTLLTNDLFGEVALFSTLLIHRSEQNNSEKVKEIWARFDDALSSESYNKNYPEGLYLGDSFKNLFRV